MADHRRRHAHKAGHGRGGQRVLQIMRAGDEDLVRVADGAARAVPLPHDFSAVHKRAVLHRLRAAEKRHLALELARHLEKNRVVHVQNGIVALGLVFKEALLEADVLRHGAMAVEMVLGDVEQRRHAGMECFDALQLETGHLDHHHVVLFALHGHRGERIADIARHMGDAARVFKDFAKQSGGGGLAVGAGNGHHLALKQRPGQFQLAHHGDAFFLCGQHHRRVDGYAGADDQTVRLRKQAHGVLPQAELTRRAAQHVKLAAKGILALAVRKHRRRAVFQKKLRRRHAAARHADHQNALVSQFHKQTTSRGNG